MAAGPRERINKLIRDVEKAERQLRKDFEKRAKSAPRRLSASGSVLCPFCTILKRQTAASDNAGP